MSKVSLFNISERYLNIEELLDNPDIPEEMLVEALEGIKEEFTQKADNVVRFIKSVEGDCETLKKEEKRLAEKRKTLENKANRMKQYLEDNMRLTGNTKFKTPFYSYSVQLNPPSVEVKNIDLIPEKYKKVETSCKIDKKAILNDVKNGESVEGIEISQGTSLRIR